MVDKRTDWCYTVYNLTKAGAEDGITYSVYCRHDSNGFNVGVASGLGADGLSIHQVEDH
jgi:hypothetical protein